MTTLGISRRARNALAAALTLLAFATPVAGAEAAVSPAAATAVGADPRYDWGTNWAPGMTKVGEVLGQDLIGAAAAADAENVTFVIKLLVLPTTFAGAGAYPGVSRYLWDFTVDGEPFEIDALFVPEDPADCAAGGCFSSPATIKGHCKVDAAGVQSCEDLATVTATYAQGPPSTISVPIPRSLIGARDGAVIAPHETAFNYVYGGNLIATSLPFSDGTYPADWMTTEPFRVLSDGVRLLEDEARARPPKKPKRRRTHRARRSRG